MAYSQTGPTYYNPSIAFAKEPVFTEQSNTIAPPTGTHEAYQYYVLPASSDPYKPPDANPASGEFSRGIAWVGAIGYFQKL
jgi:hypothetical protein